MSLDWARIAQGDLPATEPAAFDGDLSPQNILAAAKEGFYCFPATSAEEAMMNEVRHADTGSISVGPDEHEPYSVAWLCPDPRPVVDLAERRAAGRTMRRLARRRAEWRTTTDTAFDAVVEACATGRETTWITDTMRGCMHDLHGAGAAHSGEVWDGDRLIGGVFGLQLGAVFTADSQFTAVEGAGKLAVVDLMTRFRQAGGRFFDCQHDTPHVRNLGAAPMPRPDYFDALHRLREEAVEIPGDRRSAEHIADGT